MDIFDRLWDDCIVLLRTVLYINPQMAKVLLEGDANDLRVEMYDKYARNQAHYVINNLMSQYRLESRMFEDQIKQSQISLQSWATRYPKLVTVSARGTFFWTFFDKEHAEKTKFRLYLNIKIPRFSEFINRFMQMFLDGPFQCYVCGVADTHYDPSTTGMKCVACGNERFDFKFKFPIGRSIMRNDKIVMYFSDQHAALTMRTNLETLQEFFIPKSQLFTKELFPGLGFSLEPGEEETADWKAMTGEEESKTSFGDYILYIISDILVKTVQEHKSAIAKAYVDWQNSTKSLDPKAKQQFAQQFTSIIAQSLRIHIRTDSRIKSYVSKLTSIEAFKNVA